MSAKKKPIAGIIIAILCGAVMLFGSIYLVTRPIRASLSKQFVSRGDNYLSQKKYISAIVEYKKAEGLYPSREINDRISLARSVENNVMKLENFYREKNNIGQLELFNQARSVPDSSYDLVRLSQDLIKQGEPQLAAVAATTATEMDKEYRDAWLYLGVSNLSIAQRVEMSSSNSKNYLDKSRQSLEKAKSLDPSYAITNNFLKSIK